MSADLMIAESKNFFEVWHRKFNYSVFRFQAVVGGMYEKYFNMYAALTFTLLAGACLGFTGNDCHGKINFDSPIFWCLSLLILFFMFQTFILISLTFWRIMRLATVAICGHYLAGQSLGLWSLYNVDQVFNKSGAKIAEVVMRDGNICKPYAYANLTYGQMWIILPAITLIGICFFLGDKKAILYEDD